ncbi:MAG: hypothetical protein WB780_02635 [Candidatus Acidiferrales bacterium]
MSIGALSLAGGANLVRALGQNAGQAQGLQSNTSIAALKDAISSESQSILELVNATVGPGASGSQLNVYG